MPAGLRGPIFLVTGNFDVIKTYNSSTAYALAVALLGDAVRARPGRRPWPRTDRRSPRRRCADLQARLKTMGYDPGEVDGMVGEAPALGGAQLSGAQSGCRRTAMRTPSF